VLNPLGYQFGQQMLIAPYLPIAEIKQTQAKLMLQLFAHFLFPQLVIELVRKCLSCVESLFWRVDHNLSN